MSSTVSEKSQSSLYSLFKNMNTSQVMESDSLALEWLKKHQETFYGFVAGQWLNKEKLENDVKSELECHKIRDAFTGAFLCDVYAPVDTKLLEYVAEISASGFKTWSCTFDAASRSKILYDVAQAIEKHQKLFAIVESVSSAKHLYKARKDVCNLIENFQYNAGCALMLQDKSLSDRWFPTGPVCIIAEQYNNPSLALSLRVSSLLASGHSVTLLADVKSCLSSLLLAEICFEYGIPACVLNVIPIDLDKFNSLGNSSIFSKLICTGSFEKCVLFSKLCSEAELSCNFLIPRRPVVIIYENADLTAAANGVLEAFFSHDTRSKSGGCKVLIQESIHEKFLEIFKDRFFKILVGSNLSKTDMSCIVTDEQKRVLTDFIKDCVKRNDKMITLVPKSTSFKYTSIMPTLFTNLQTSCKLVHQELGGPIIVTARFRTLKESIAMFNSDNKGSPVNIWTEHMSVALEAALKLKSGVVWVNTGNVIDATTAFTGIYLSGNSAEGGKNAFFSHMSPLEIDRINKKVIPLQSFDYRDLPSSIQSEKKIVNEYKLFIGGIYKQSEGTVLLDESTLISFGKDSDVQSAISSAFAAQSKWEAFTDFQKRKFLIDIMETLCKKREDYVYELQRVSESSLDDSQKEVDDTLNILHYWIAQNDKFSGPFQEVKNLMVLQNKKPLGVVGIQCPNEKPLLSFVSLVIPAIAYGNGVVAVASTRYPTLALKMCEIFSSANLPGGVINVVWGNISHLVPALYKQTDVNAIWYTDMPSKIIYSHCNVYQRMFYCNGIWNSINEATCLKFALESTYTKSIFLPANDIFAN